MEKTRTCEQIKANGEQCRRPAIWGLEPPRCSGHREDGGPKAIIDGRENMGLLSKYYYGGRDRLRAYKRDAPKTRLAKLFAQFRFLADGIKAAQEAEDFKQLVRLVHLKTEVTLRIVDIVEEFGEELSFEALEAAAIMVRVIQAERRKIEESLQEKGIGSLQRSPGYWAVYRFLKAYMETYHICPTQQEIVKGTGLTSKSSVNHFVRQLEQDGFAYRLPGQSRNVRLVELDPPEN